MPLISRTIEPRYLSRRSLLDENGRSLVKDYELEAIANNTLSNVLRQLASLVLVANDIFEDLAKQLEHVYERSCKLKTIICRVEENLVEYDPKKVTVPESDICTFSLRTIHFKSSQTLTTGLFTASSRPQQLQKLYESAAPTPVHTIRQLDRFRRDGTRSSKFFVCTPVLSGRKKKYKKVDLEIETRKPTVVEDLRRWTSTEALGDITVLPDNTSKIPLVETTQGDETKDEIDHLLPSPEEQMLAVAMKFPPSIVAVDISGKAFDRMSGMRRSLMVGDSSDACTTRRRTKRRHRGKRRNTIAGTSQKEIEQAIAGDTATETEGYEFEPLPPLRSRSTDLFKLSKGTLSPTDNLKNHFNIIKNWSKTKLRFMNYKNSSTESCKPSFQETDVVDDIGIYETIASSSSSSGNKHKRDKDRKQSSSSSAISIPASTSSMATSLVVKLRENSLQRRHWRKSANKGQDEPAHSSSGNWSASSESGRTSIASETTALPKSSTTTSNNSLNHHHQTIQNHNHHPPPSVQSRRRYLNTSTSSSVSEGTLTPDINDMQFHDFIDGETSSIYSCDTEGYYTSFHMDSGLKTLKEEETGLSFSTLQLQEESTPSLTTTFNNTSSSGASTVKTNQQLTAENEYELFGKGSTSTTTSSAGTVCTTLLAGNTYGSTRSLSQFAPAVPERKSSLERKSDKKQIGQIKEANEIHLVTDNACENDELDKARVVALIHDSPSPDSGHNTSSSPAESESQKSHSPNEHLDFSESDLESCDRTERIRTKTAMTTCRIPSMCLITPPQSDDEINLRFNNQVPYGVKYVPYETVVQQEVIIAKNNQNILNGKLFAKSNSPAKPLQIQIPKVVELKKEIGDIYSYPDKSKKVKLDSVKTISTNGILETNIDSVVDEEKNPSHLIVNGGTECPPHRMEMQTNRRSPSPSGALMTLKGKDQSLKPSQPSLKPSLLPTNFMERFKEVLNKQKKAERKNEEGDYVTIYDSEKPSKTDHKHSGREEIKPEYVSLNELPLSKKTGENPLVASNDGSLERKKRQGARVTLDSEGKVVYSSDSLKRKKQHSTFIPGKFVRESPTPSPVAEKRVSKLIRPVNTSGLIRTNSDDKSQDNRGTISPQMEKLIIKAGPRSCESPTKDVVRMPANRVVSAAATNKRNDKGVRISLENGEVKNGSVSSDASNSLERKLKANPFVSPSSSSSLSTETKKLQSDFYAEEGKILNEEDLDDLGENLGSDFFNQLDSIKFSTVPISPNNPSLQNGDNHPIPDIFRIEPEVHNQRKQIKRSDSYRMANHSLSLPSEYAVLPKLTTLTENGETQFTKSKCKISTTDPNYSLLMPKVDDTSTAVKQNHRTSPRIFSMSSRSPHRVTKPVDIEIAKVLSVRRSSRWISQHPAVSQQPIYSQSGFPRNHPMYWTLPARSVYAEDFRKSTGSTTEKLMNDNNNMNPSSQPLYDSSDLKTPPKSSLPRNRFTSSTPSKEPLQNSNSINLEDNMSPILKDNLFNSKSKMTAEEIFAAIHKSKKKLNIKRDSENRSESPQSSSSLSPDGSEKSLTLSRSRERSSWSPNTQEADLKMNEARTRRSWIGSGTPINSFKKLLLQQGVKNLPSKNSKISAVEQLKLTKNGPNSNGSIYSNLDNQIKPINGKPEIRTPPRGLLNSRSRNHWRFASPRTDILSSTIPEDCSEVEKLEENTATMQDGMNKSGSRFVRSEGSDRDNTAAKLTGICEVKKENKSFEITKKYLQQARKNFFGDPGSPNTIGIPATASPIRNRPSFNFEASNSDKSMNQVRSIPYGNNQTDSIKNFVNSSEKKMSSVISLETAL